MMCLRTRVAPSQSRCLWTASALPTAHGRLPVRPHLSPSLSPACVPQQRHKQERSMKTSALALSIAVPAAVGALGIAAVILAFLDVRKHTRLPVIHYPDSSKKAQEAVPLHKRVLQRCAALQRLYKPFPFLTNRHVETIFGSRFRKSPADVKYLRQIMVMPDGGSVALDWEHTPEPDQALHADAPVLILLPGLTGGSGDSYVQWAVQSAAARGFRAVVFNGRGTANSPVTTPQYYSASYTGDMRAVVSHVRHKYPNAPIMAAGWSLGANIMMKYLGEEGANTPLVAAVSMCNPFNLPLSDRNFQIGINQIYNWNLASALKKIHARHKHLWVNMPPPFDMELINRCTTIREFDAGLTIHSFGWPDVDAYYAGSSSALSVPNIRIPLLCVQALDDPIAPEEAIPYKALSENPYTVLVTTTTGGHLGWCGGEDGPRQHPWSDRPMIEWLESVITERWPRDWETTASASAPADAASAQEQRRPVYAATAVAGSESVPNVA